MDGIELIFSIATFAGVLFWYCRNEENGRPGDAGFLAITRDTELDGRKSGPSYRIRPRIARRSYELRNVETMRERAAVAKRRYRDLDKEDRPRRYVRKHAGPVRKPRSDRD